MILVIDNYDSFTWNLVHLIGAIRPDVEVKRNDSLTIDESLAMRPDAIVISPGPCTPDEAGISVGLVRAAAAEGIPLLGVCLGHQSIVQAAGGRIVRARRLMHGRTSDVTITAPDPLFEGVADGFVATRYHSLVAERASVPDNIRVLARASDDDEIMACRWGDAPIWGLQFHPESIASAHGDRLIGNFLGAAGAGARAA